MSIITRHRRRGTDFASPFSHYRIRFDITLKENFFNAEHSLHNGYEDYVAPPEFDSDETNDLYSEQIGYNRGGMGGLAVSGQ